MIGGGRRLHKKTPPHIAVSCDNSVTDCDHIVALSACEQGCMACPVRSSCIVDRLTIAQTMRFEKIIHHDKPKRKGKHLYWQDSPFRSIYIVRSGAIKTYRISESGRERILGFHLPGEMVGLDGLYRERYTDSAVALDTTAVCELSFDEFSALFTEIKGLRKRFLSAMYAEVLIEQKKHFLDSKTIEEKVAAFILDLAARYQRKSFSSDTFKLLMTRRDIANYLGMAMESVSRALTRFQQRGWLQICGHEVTIKNFHAIHGLLADYQDELDL